MGSAAKASRSSARVWILRRVAATLTAATLFLACQPAPPVATSRPTSGTQPSSTLATSSAEPTPSFHATSDGVAPQGPTQQATVTRITDGDTIRVEFGGTEYRLRYIGMDAPESVDPSRPDQPGGHEATLANTALVAACATCGSRQTPAC
jgi:endonuclease YncB( thermonuclease family)